MEQGPQAPDHNSDPDAGDNAVVEEPVSSRGRRQARGRGRGPGRPRGGNLEAETNSYPATAS